MELIPLVKLALTIFTALTAVIVSISYIVYKIKKRQQKGLGESKGPIVLPAPKIQPYQPVQQYHPDHQEMQRQQSVPASARITDAMMREQSKLANQRAAQLAQQKKYQPRRPEQRFQIVNDQSKYRNHQIYANNPADKPFYHPSNSPALRAQQQNDQPIPETRFDERPAVQRPPVRPVPPTHAPPRESRPAQQGDIFSRYSTGKEDLGKVKPPKPSDK